MSRKPKKGYYVQGVFIALGSELDLAYKRELKGTDAASKTDLKRESTERQKLGEDLLELRADLKQKLLEKGHLNTLLMDAVNEAKRITNFEGKRRQMQYVGKLMRRLDEEDLQAIRDSLEIQHGGSAKETLALHESEAWRKRLIEDDQALGEWLSKYPRQEPQQFRALVRQARKDAQPLTRAEISTGHAPRQGRAYRELFRWVRETLHPSRVNPDPHSDESALLELHDTGGDEAHDVPAPIQAQPLYLSVEEIKYKEEVAREELKAAQAEKDRRKEEAIAKKKRTPKVAPSLPPTAAPKVLKAAKAVKAVKTAAQKPALKPALKLAQKTAKTRAQSSTETTAAKATTPGKTPKAAPQKESAKPRAKPAVKPTGKTAAKTALKTALKTAGKTAIKTSAKTAAKSAAKTSTKAAPATLAAKTSAPKSRSTAAAKNKPVKPLKSSTPKT